MHRPPFLYVGLRYLRAKRRNHFISFISLISVSGIALGVAALIIVISVMNGFESELRSRILGMVAHATVAGFGEDLQDWPRAVATAEADPEVVAAAPYIEREAMLQGGRVTGALLRGVLPEREPAVAEALVAKQADLLERLKAGEFGIVLGRELAIWLGVEEGDSIVVYAPQVQATPVGLVPTLKRVTVVGIFEIGMHEYDRGIALMHISDAARLFRMGEGVTGVRLKLEDMYRARVVANRLTEDLGEVYRVRDWTQQHSNFFKAVQTEKTVMFIILSLIVGVAAFNIISTLVMMVVDKQADIAVLRTLGMSPWAVMGVFLVQGSLIGVFGTFCGVVIGTLLALNLEVVVPWIERMIGRPLIPGDIYYISELPSKVVASDIVQIALLALVLALLAGIYPSWRASRVDPAAALRYE